MADYVKYIRSMVGNNKIMMNASGCIVVKDNQILLQRRSDNGYWGLVGGIMELGETYQEGALREVKEETGLEVNLDYLVGIYHNYNMEWPSGDKAHVICAIYKASIISGTLRLDEESLELKFFDPDKLPPLFSTDHIQAIDAYLQGIKDDVK